MRKSIMTNTLPLPQHANAYHSTPMKTYYLLRIAGWLTRIIPVRTGYWLCSLIGGIVFYLNPAVREAVVDNMRHVLPGSSRHQRRSVARRVIRNAVKNYYDLVRLPHLDKNEVERKVTVYGVEHITKALDEGKGLILFSGHIGNYNLVAQVAAARGYPTTIIAEDIHPPRLYDYVNKLRARFGLHMVRAGSSEVRQIYRLLRSGDVLMLAVDRDVTDTGIPVRFFDAPTKLPEGPVALALRLNTPLVPAHTRRLPNNSSVVYIHPPLELQCTGHKELDLQVNLRRVAESLEEMILAAPDQWTVLQHVWDKHYTGNTVSKDQGPEDGEQAENSGLPVRIEAAPVSDPQSVAYKL